MNASKTHTHSCRTRGCDGKVTHFDDMCPSREKPVLCTPCLQLEQMPATGRAASDWDPYAEQDSPQAVPNSD